jgi:hypothetical protein
MPDVLNNWGKKGEGRGGGKRKKGKSERELGD